MKQVLAVRVGAKKAVGHIVSKRWWPTVPVALDPRHVFKSKKVLVFGAMEDIRNDKYLGRS